jgi:hypothetical protein
MAVDRKSFLIGHSFLDFVCLFGLGPRSGGNNEKIRWESVPTRPFLAKFKQQRGLEGVALRQWASRPTQYKTKLKKQMFKKLSG